MVCKRSHAVAFHLTNPVGGIALEIVKEVKESCRGLAWVGRIWILPWKFDLWNSLKGLTVYEPFTQGFPPWTAVRAGHGGVRLVVRGRVDGVIKNYGHAVP